MWRSLTLLIGLSACGPSTEVDESSPANAIRESRVFSGEISEGDHGPIFYPDELLRDARARQARQREPVEVLGYLVEAERQNPRFESAFAAAVEQGLASGVSRTSMVFRVQLRGRITNLSEGLSGFTQGFEVDEMSALRLCPKAPRSLDGCSN